AAAPHFPLTPRPSLPRFKQRPLGQTRSERMADNTSGNWIADLIHETLITSPTDHAERSDAVNITDGLFAIAAGLDNVATAIRTHTEATERSDMSTRKALLVSGRP